MLCRRCLADPCGGPLRPRTKYRNSPAGRRLFRLQKKKKGQKKTEKQKKNQQVRQVQPTKTPEFFLQPLAPNNPTPPK